MQHPPIHIFEQTPETLGQWCESQGMPAYRGKQIIEWVYEKHITDPLLMSNLSRLDREKIAEGVTFSSGFTVAHSRATDGVQKLLVQWKDFAKGQEGGVVAVRAIPGEACGSTVAGDSGTGSIALPILQQSGQRAQGAQGAVESVDEAAVQTVLLPEPSDTRRQTECVLIPTDDRKTACISSQVGCPVGCKFCASGMGGLDANLSAGRIVEQVWRLGTLPEIRRVSNVVFMGMGEPLSNFDAVTAAIRTMNQLWGLGISARKITISTVGLPKYIKRLRDEFELPVTLALSLHATNDDLRRQLIPWSEFTTIEELLDACHGWFEKTGREITLEYTLLRGVNDSPMEAARLAELAQTLRANVNLIRYNEVAGIPFSRPKTDDVLQFQQVLRNRNVNVHIRASRGRDIAAACGQLRHEHGK